jgi:tRNA pseudouridine65 synthase
VSKFADLAPLNRNVTVICESPTGLVALAKPVGALSHPNEPADQRRSMLTCPYSIDGEFFEWTDTSSAEPSRTWLLNRLDSATSGVVLLARSEALAKHIRQHFKHRQVQKVYAALVFGRSGLARADWRDRLSTAKRGGRVRTAARGNVPAETAMQQVESVTGRFGTLSLVQLEPKTGRSHQLRVQCAHRKLPIVGDATYGDFKRNRSFAKASGLSRLFLHSYRTAFSFDWEGQHHKFAAEAPLPPEFNAALTT